jgi:hypothetical protein
MNIMKYLSRLLVSIILVLFLFQNSEAQDLVKSRSTFCIAGSSKYIHANGNNFFVQQSIGQSSVIGINKNNNVTLRQGFIQPLSHFVISKSPDILKAVVYQNQFSEEIIMTFNEEISENLYVSVYDLYGRIVFSQRYEPAQEIRMKSRLASPVLYILRVNTMSKYFVTKLIN